MLDGNSEFGRSEKIRTVKSLGHVGSGADGKGICPGQKGLVGGKIGHRGPRSRQRSVGCGELSPELLRKRRLAYGGLRGSVAGVDSRIHRDERIDEAAVVDGR